MPRESPGYVRFVLLGHRRVGSSLLTELLQSHGAVIMYGEVFQPESARRVETTWPDPPYCDGGDGARYLREVIYRDGVEGLAAVGFKLFYHHAREGGASARAWEFLIADREVRLIHLQRRNLLRALLSAERAKRSGQWSVMDPTVIRTAPPIRLEPARCQAFFAEIRAARARARDDFDGHRVIDVEYERDLCRSTDDTARRLCEFLGLEPRRLTCRTHQLARQPAAVEIENYEELRRHFEDTEFAVYFEHEARDPEVPPEPTGLLATRTARLRKQRGPGIESAGRRPPLARRRLAVRSSRGVGGDVLAEPWRGSRAVHLTSAKARLLARCRGFRLLSEHARQCCLGLGVEARHADAVEDVLEDLSRAGLFIGEDELRTRILSHADAPRSEPPITTVAAVTRDRPAALERALTSYVENARLYARDLRLQVLDGAADAAARESLREKLRAHAGNWGVPVCYAGTEEKRQFADRLSASSGVAPDVVDFALFDPLGLGQPYGANRNAQLLASVGHRAVSIDDDTLCRWIDAPGESQGLEFSSDPPPMHYEFHPTLEAGLATHASIDCDVLGQHERLLGRDVAELVAEESGPVVFDRVDSVFLSRLLRKPLRVIVTQPGILGDSGGANPAAHVLRARGASRDRLLASPEAYQSALFSREGLRCVRRPTVHHGERLMATTLGLDARALLPPFLPVFRCEDNLYGVYFQRIRTDGVSGHLPGAIVHAPCEPRFFPEDAMALCGGALPMALLIAALIRQIDPGDGPGDWGPEQTLEHLGSTLEAMGGASPTDFEHQVSQAVRAYLVRHREGLDWLLGQMPDAPAFWRRDVLAYRAALDRRLKSGRLSTPLELEHRAGDESARLTRELVRRFGELLRAWPTLWSSARSLVANGVPLAREL